MVSIHGRNAYVTSFNLPSSRISIDNNVRQDKAVARICKRDSYASWILLGIHYLALFSENAIEDVYDLSMDTVVSYC